ncbi:large subunit ribosomal protein L25 [Caminicella sporogenes DSM 14501]|uniref:Large ribosomal subunit protein bL25 n=1 Tax=Caminicella sporogenes DSM 14501 TaxID=1121266 RepID=A0A1M6THC8_9FIRM|nr:50S ribosomal protein L25 [Caminicella sporogenes]RKD24862.1 5S rRNA E-loop-binding protein [Caminicella sporogenes]SHK56395.1 large subunit ribosomal protein L25 [Caminicella sporogenes DSM 14501]
MSEAILRAFERTEKPKKCRRQGYVPGIIYGEGFENGQKIKIQLSEARELIKENTKNLRLWVQIGKEKKYGVIKEIQKHPMTKEIQHIDIQAISQKDKVRLKLPVIFEGREKMEQKGQILQVLISEVEVIGKIEKIPESININVSNKELGDSVKVKDIQLDDEIKILEDVNEVLAIVTAAKPLDIAS